MKPEGSLFAVVQVALKAECDAAEGQIGPRNLGWREQYDLKAFFTGRKVWCLQPATIEKMYLIDMGDIDQGEGSVHRHFRAGFFACFTDGSLRRTLAILHEATGQGPVAMAWLYGASAHEDFSFPFGDTADDESRIFVMDMTACGAYVARKRIPGRDGKGDAGAAANAVLIHDWSG